MSKGKRRFWVVTKEKAAIQIIALIEKRKAIGYCSKRWQAVAIAIKLLPHWMRKRM